MENKPKVALYARFANEESTKNELVTALYCRTAQACAMGIANQEAVLRQYAENNGISGLNLDRPAMRKLQADVEAGTVGLVVAKDVPRISRNHQDLFDFIDEMADVGVEVKFTTGDFAMGESFSANLKKRQAVYHQFLQSKKRTRAV